MSWWQRSRLRRLSVETERTIHDESFVYHKSPISGNMCSDNSVISMCTIRCSIMPSNKVLGVQYVVVLALKMKRSRCFCLKMGVFHPVKLMMCKTKSFGVSTSLDWKSRVPYVWVKLIQLVTIVSVAGKEQDVKFSLPRVSSLNDSVDHGPLLKVGSSVSERVNRFDAKPGTEGVGFSKLQETRRIFEQRVLQVRNQTEFTCLLCFISISRQICVVSIRRSKQPPTESCWRRSGRLDFRTADWTSWLVLTAPRRRWTVWTTRPSPCPCPCPQLSRLLQVKRAPVRPLAPQSASSAQCLKKESLKTTSTSPRVGQVPL